MGYIKKLKNNELVGGTDKTTIYPVTSAEAVFEEVSDDEFKSQKYLNNHITNERIVDNTIENRKLKDDTIDMGKLNTQLKTIIQTAYDASWKVKEEPFSLETKYDANDVVYDPDTNSSYVSLTADNQGNPVKLEDEEAVNPYWRLVINGISAIQATKEIEATKDELIDYIQENLKDQVDDEIADAESRVAAAEEYAQGVVATAETMAQQITDWSSSEISSTPSYTDQHPLSNRASTAQIGYYTCSGGSGATIIVDDTDAAAFTPVKGGHIKILMTQRSAVTSGNVQLQFGSVTATKKVLLYNEGAVSLNNTWEPGEVIAVYYDGTKYHASNAQGGSNKKIDAYLLGELRTLAVGDHYKKGEAVKTIDKQLLVLTDDINPVSLTEEISEGLLRFRSNITYLSKTAIKNYSDTPSVPYTSGDYAIGSPAGAVIQVTVNGTAIAALEEATDITVTIAGIELTVTVDSTMDAAGVAAAIYTAFGTQDEWKLTDNEDGTLTLISKVAKNAAPTISATTGDTGITIQFVEDSVYAGSLQVSVLDNDIWTEVNISDYIASTDIWEQKDATWIAENKCRQNSIRNILAVPRKVEFEHTGGGKASTFNIYKFFPVEKNKRYTVTLKTLNSLDLGSSRLTLGFSNSNEVAFTNVDLAIERSFILTPTSYSTNVSMYVWCNQNTRNTRFHVTISWTDYIDNIASGFELLMEEYNKRNAKYVTEEKIIRGLASPTGVYINALTDDANFGKVCKTNGVDYRTTDYIPCKGVAKINAALFLANNGWGYGLAFYDENKVPIRTSAEYWNYSNTGPYNRWLIDVPKNACYFRNSQWKQDPYPFTFYYDTFSSESIQNSLEAVQENVNAIKDEVFDIPESVPASSRYSYYGEKLTFKEHQFTSEQYMSLSLSGNGQGAANYGKYYIVGNSNGIKFDVFNLETKTKLGVITVPTPSISYTHSNTIAFSNKFYEEGDEFPIMYNCSGYGTGSNPTTFAVYGYRIINNNGEFTATLVHTITLTGTGGWTEFVIDNENNTAWIKLESPTLGFVWYKVSMPAPSNGDVTIDLDSLTPEFKVPSYLGSAQGHLFFKGKIYFTSDSLTDSNIHRLYVLDVSIGRFSAIINTAFVYNSETENVFVYNEHLFIGYRGRVYKLYFD